MYCKLKMLVVICLLLFSPVASSKSLYDKLKDLISFNLPKDIFASINDDIIGNLKAKSVKFLLPNKLEIEDIEIVDEFGARVLYAKHIEVTVSLISLLTSNIRITDVLVDSLFFNYTINNKIQNIVRVFESKTNAPSSNSKTRVSIENLRLINASFEMHHDAGVEIFAHKISAEGRFWVEGGPFGVNVTKLRVENGGIMVGGMDLPLANLIAKDLYISDEKVYAKTLNAQYGQSKISATGTVFIEDERYDIRCKMDAPAGTYPVGLKPLFFKTPAFKADIEMLGELVDPEFLTQVIFQGTKINEMHVNEGRAEVQINQHKVIIKSAEAKVGGGKISANGEIDIDEQTFNFNTTQKEIPILELVNFIEFRLKTQGIFSADSRFNGTFKDRVPTINMQSRGKINNGSVEEIKFPEESSYEFNGNLFLENRLKINKAIVKNQTGLDINFSGEIDLINKVTLGKYHLYCPKVEDYISLPLKSTVKGLKARGKLSFDKQLAFSADARIQAMRISGLDTNDLTAKMEFGKNKLLINELMAKAYGGSISLKLTMDNFFQEKKIQGKASITELDLNKLSKSLNGLSLGGLLSSSLSLDGNFESPTIYFNSSVTDFIVDKLQLYSSEIEGKFHKNNLKITKFNSNSMSGSIFGNNLFYDLDSKKIGGEIEVDDLDISSAFSMYKINMDGYIKGVINIDGTIHKPSITSPMTVKKFTAYGFNLGTGAMSLSLSDQPLIGQNKERDLVFSASCNLSEGKSKSIGRFSYALNKKTINSEIKLEEIELNTADLGLTNKFFGIIGQSNGKFTAEGSINSPVLNAEILIKEYGFFDTSIRKDSIQINKKYGPAIIKAKNKNGKIDLSLCASFQENLGIETCKDDSEFVLNASGPFNFDKFELNFNAKLAHRNLEDVILPLKKEFVSLGAIADVNGTLRKDKDRPIQYLANVQVNNLYFRLPNIPNISLAFPVSLTVSNHGLSFSKDAQLQFFPGELAIGGSISSSKVDLHAQGEIPLVLSRLFFPMVQSADGLASGKIRIFGPSDAIMLEGAITPQYGSTFTLRKWLEPIRVKEGSVIFEKISSTSYKSKFNNIRLSVGDGKISLNGDAYKQYRPEKNDSLFAFDMDMQGSNIVIRDGLNFIESDFNIHTAQKLNTEPIINGNITITDGSAHRQFDLRNFVAKTQNSFKSGSFKFLENTLMNINLSIAVRQFKASASMLNLDIDTSLRGQLTLEGPLSRPKFKGALSVSEGSIKFPATSFDLVNSQIVLDETSNKIFDPKIDIVAIEELRESDYSVLQHDTTVELSLRGDLDKLNIELKPINGDRNLSQLKIFMILLSPKNSEMKDQSELFGDLKQGAKQAAMAFSGEVFLRPLTNELQELMEGATKTRIQLGSSLDPGGFTFRLNWKVGPRIELQGSYIFLNRRDKPSDDRKSEDIDLGDLKLKLLLFDHKPFGPLSLESSFGTVRRRDQKEEAKAKILLKYRIFYR